MDAHTKKGEKKLKRSDRAFFKALCALLKDKTLDKIHVREICAEADYTSMAFYANYENKYALAKAIIDHEIEIKFQDSISALQALNKDNAYSHQRMMYEVSLLFFDRVYSHPDIYRCIFENQLMPDAMHYFSSETAKKYHKVFVTDQSLQLSQYADYLYELVTLNLLSAASLWLKNDFDISSKTYAKLYSSYMTDWSTNIILDQSSSVMHII